VVINFCALSDATEAYNYSTVTRRIFIDTLVVPTYIIEILCVLLKYHVCTVRWCVYDHGCLSQFNHRYYSLRNYSIYGSIKVVTKKKKQKRCTKWYGTGKKVWKKVWFNNNKKSMKQKNCKQLISSPQPLPVVLYINHNVQACIKLLWLFIGWKDRCLLCGLHAA